MAEPATVIVAAGVVGLLLGALAAAIFVYGGFWPLMFFLTATAIDSTNDKAAD